MLFHQTQWNYTSDALNFDSTTALRSFSERQVNETLSHITITNF